MAVGGELHAAGAGAAIGPIGRAFVGGRIEGGGVDGRGIDEQLRCLGRGVVDHEVAALAGDEGLAVGQPGGRAGKPGAASPAAPRALEGFERDRLLLREGGKGEK